LPLIVILSARTAANVWLAAALLSIIVETDHVTATVINNMGRITKEREWVLHPGHNDLPFETNSLSNGVLSSAIKRRKNKCDYLFFETLVFFLCN